MTGRAERGRDRFDQVGYPGVLFGRRVEVDFVEGNHPFAGQI